MPKPENEMPKPYDLQMRGENDTLNFREEGQRNDYYWKDDSGSGTGHAVIDGSSGETLYLRDTQGNVEIDTGKWI